MSDFEWGYRYQRINKSNGREGRLFRTPVPTLSAARELVREYSDDSGRWEVAVIWREPGTAEWHDYEPGGVPGGEVDPQVLSDLLSLTSAGVIPPAVIATWTTAERERAATWAAAEDLHASGHTEIARVPQPSVVAEAAELAANPAMAQLAVEGWTSVLENVERSGRAIPPEMGMALGAARRAITGLLVLTEAEEKRGAWRRKAARVMEAHPTGLSVADLMMLVGAGGPTREQAEEWLAAGEAAGRFERAGISAWRLRRPQL